MASGAANTIRSLWVIAKDLRDIGVLRAIPAAPLEAWQWAAPSRVPSARSRHFVGFLRAAVARGAEPALLDATEVEARLTREAAAQRTATAEVRGPSIYARPRTVADQDAEVRAAVERVTVIP